MQRQEHHAVVDGLHNMLAQGKPRSSSESKGMPSNLSTTRQQGFSNSNNGSSICVCGHHNKNNTGHARRTAELPAMVLSRALPMLVDIDAYQIQHHAQAPCAW